MNEFDLPKEVKEDPNKIETEESINGNIEQQPQNNNAENMSMQSLINNNNEQNNTNNNNSSKLIIYAILNAIIIFILNYSWVNHNKYIAFALPVYVVIFGFITAIKYQKSNDFPTSLLLGGVLCGIITFLISIKAEDSELYTHYAISSAACGILGYTLAAVINGLITNKQKTGVQILGSLIYFAALIGVPYYINKKYPNIINNYVLYHRTEIIAKTENEFITETLKNRYGIKFVCGKDISNVKGFENDRDIVGETSQIDQDNRLLTVRKCIDENNVQFDAISIEYNKSKIQYIVEDTYFEITKMEVEKENIIKLIKGAISVESVKVYMYPKKNCHFIGDCIDTDEYFEIYETENNFNNLYENSKSIDLRKYVSDSSKDFINNFGFKYQIFVYGKYQGMDEGSAFALVESIISTLNDNNYKNNNGYEIIIIDTSNKDLQRKVLSVKGEASTNKYFENPQIDK